MKKIAISIIATFLICLLSADEPGWTEKQRAEKRDIVLKGEVQKINELPESKKDQWTEVWKAEIKISEIEKGPDDLKAKTIPILFYRGAIIKKNGTRYKRCPRYADLQVGKRYKFFIKEGKGTDDEKVYRIEMSSDAILDANLTGSNMTIKQAFEKSTSIFRGIKLNDSGLGVCSEMGVINYLGDFSITEMLYGEKLAKKNIKLSYIVMEFRPRYEKPVEKNENVIIFLNKKEAVKIIPDNQETLKQVKLLIKGK